MMPIKKKTEWLIAFSTSVGAGIALIFFLIAQWQAGFEVLFPFCAPAVFAAATLAMIPLTKSRHTYWGLQAFGVVCCLFAIAGAQDMLSVQLIILFAFLVEMVLFEPYPSNLLWTIGVSAVATVIRVSTDRAGAVHALAVAEHQVPFALPALSLSLFGSFMTKHREQVVDLDASCRQLTESVVNLAKANTAYQDFAVDAGERAIEAERRRITRDIHDIVGYTLTNNMMLMEAALDLMKENPLALPGIIETARHSAEEGLEQVRSAMYELRKQESYYPVGLNAIARLVKTFEQATSIRIKSDYANMPLSVSEEVDSAVYHLVQEALVNSFRHGKATEVQVRFWYGSDTVMVRVSDNGGGSTKVTEGIGLSGMRERITGLGGTVRAITVEGGFLVDASIPHTDRKNDG